MALINPDFSSIVKDKSEKESYSNPSHRVEEGSTARVEPPHPIPLKEVLSCVGSLFFPSSSPWPRWLMNGGKAKATVPSTVDFPARLGR